MASKGKRTTGTVGCTLADAHRTARPSASAPAALPAPDGLRATPLGDGVVLLDFALVEPCIPEHLSGAQAWIARRLFEGVSLEDIAAQRGVSRRTVEKQASATYDKLGVGSRAELQLKLRPPGTGHTG